MNANGNNRARWTDERLDRLADSVSELRESITATNKSITAINESITAINESITETNDSVDGLRVTAQALLQLAAQQQQVERERHEEMQQVQLEIRNINEHLDVQQGQIRVLLERLLSGS
jgi:uncharacterized coiled-coil DUF342 family protein